MNRAAGNLPELEEPLPSQAVADVLQPRGLELKGIRFWTLHLGERINDLKRR